MPEKSEAGRGKTGEKKMETVCFLSFLFLPGPKCEKRRGHLFANQTFTEGPSISLCSGARSRSRVKTPNQSSFFILPPHFSSSFFAIFQPFSPTFFFAISMPHHSYSWRDGVRRYNSSSSLQTIDQGICTFS